MSIPRQIDANGDPYLWTPGDLGVFVYAVTGRNAETGEKIIERVVIPGTALFTGGLSATGSPTLAKGHSALTSDDIPMQYPWPRSLGPDPR